MTYNNKTRNQIVKTLNNLVNRILKKEMITIFIHHKSKRAFE